LRACKRHLGTIVPGPGKARTGAAAGLGKALAARDNSGVSEDRDKTGKEAPKTTPGKTPKGPPEPREIGGPKGPEPTRYGDWERGGRCTDF
jgi:hypothetical protein